MASVTFSVTAPIEVVPLREVGYTIKFLEVFITSRINNQVLATQIFPIETRTPLARTLHLGYIENVTKRGTEYDFHAKLMRADFTVVHYKKITAKDNGRNYRVSIVFG